MKTYQDLQKEVNDLRALRDTLQSELLRQQDKNITLMTMNVTVTNVCLKIAKEYNGLADHYDSSGSSYSRDRSQDNVNSLINHALKTASSLFPELNNYL